MTALGIKNKTFFIHAARIQCEGKKIWSKIKNFQWQKFQSQSRNVEENEFIHTVHKHTGKDLRNVLKRKSLTL